MTEELQLPAPIVDEMVRHCLAERPNEGCGILAVSNRRAVKLFPMANASASPVRYSLEPREQLGVYKVLNDNFWDFAVFHSHTRTAAYPSPTDVREAREDVPYVIVSVARDTPSIRAFRIRKADWLDEHGDVVELPVLVAP